MASNNSYRNSVDTIQHKDKIDKYEKILFFKELDGLDCLSDSESENGQRSKDDDDDGLVPGAFIEGKVLGQSADLCVSGTVSSLRDGLSQRDPVSKSISSTPRSSAVDSGQRPGSGSRSDTDSNAGSLASSPLATSERDSSSKPNAAKRAPTSTGPPASENMKTTDHRLASKRKREYAPRTVPEDQQIFKGLLFFFFPNNDISPLRRLRIQRAQEHGAVWTKTWEVNVTHVIVDKGLVFKDILTFLKLDSFPPSVAVVDECYPSECIKFRSVLSPTHARFRVNGAPTETKESPPPINESSVKSLQVKPLRGKANFPTPQPLSESEPVPELPHEVTSGIHPSRQRDILDDIIDEAKAVKDLPLDPLDSFAGESSPNEADTDSAEESEPETAERKRRKTVRKGSVKENWQQKFACMRKYGQSSGSENPNMRTIEVLQQMLDYYRRTADHWRVIAYRKAISALRKQPKNIISRSQALSIPGIGVRLADKIEEIVWTNRLRRLENASCTREDRALQEFLGVYGVGISQASKWVAQGHRSLEDLRTKVSLTKNQKIGLEHYHDFAQRIPRDEVAAHGEIVRKAVQKVDPDMQVIISGSYRRGASDCGDIDVLITKPDAKIDTIRTIMMDTVVPKLFKQGFLQASLASTSRGDGCKWHGASVLPGSKVWRRIDLLYVPGSEIGAALIYFTGNDIFNRSMRLLASKKGMCLNQRGLYTDVLRGEQRVKLARGRLVEGRDEKRIFEILGVPWRPPEHRIC